jgi:hypothetical protein
MKGTGLNGDDEDDYIEYPNTPNLYEYEGRYFCEFGILQIANCPDLCATGYEWADPPVYQPEVYEWFQAQTNFRYIPTPLVGPPSFEFPSEEKRTEFLTKFCRPFNYQEKKAKRRRWAKSEKRNWRIIRDWQSKSK